jgi:predicted dehydrogenase
VNKIRVIRVGIVGTGNMAHAHADAFKRILGVELTSCLDVVPGRAQEFQRRHGVKHVAADLDDLLERCHAVSVVTPDRFHAELSIKALRAGKHVLCEKPLSVTLSEAKRVAREARKASQKGVRHLINFTYRRSAASEKAMALVKEGILGDVRHVHGFYLQTWLSAPVWGHWSKEAWLWRLKRGAGPGGALADIGSHILDLATAVSGSVKRIRCDLRTFPKITEEGKAVTRWNGKPLDANDTAVIELEFQSGAIGVLHATRWATGHKNHLRLEVHGTKGALMLDLDRNAEVISTCSGGDALSVTWRTQRLRPISNLYQRFIRSIRVGTQAEPSLLRGAQVQAYLDACERSSRSGKWEKAADLLRPNGLR